MKGCLVQVLLHLVLQLVFERALLKVVVEIFDGWMLAKAKVRLGRTEASRCKKRGHGEASEDGRLAPGSRARAGRATLVLHVEVERCVARCSARLPDARDAWLELHSARQVRLDACTEARVRW